MNPRTKKIELTFPENEFLYKVSMGYKIAPGSCKLFLVNSNEFSSSTRGTYEYTDNEIGELVFTKGPDESFGPLDQSPGKNTVKYEDGVIEFQFRYAGLGFALSGERYKVGRWETGSIEALCSSF